MSRSCSRRAERARSSPERARSSPERARSSPERARSSLERAPNCVEWARCVPTRCLCALTHAESVPTRCWCGPARRRPSMMVCIVHGRCGSSVEKEGFVDSVVRGHRVVRRSVDLRGPGNLEAGAVSPRVDSTLRRANCVKGVRPRVTRSPRRAVTMSRCSRR